MQLQVAAQIALGIDARVILFNSAETTDRYRQSGIPCFVLDEQQRAKALFFNLKQLVSSGATPVLITHGYKELFYAMAIKALTHCPVVVVFHGLAEPHSSFLPQLKAKLYFATARLLAKKYADRIVCVSSALARSIGILKLEKTIVVHNCFAQQNINHEKDINLQAGKSQQKVVIFMAGRLVPIKRYDLAIAAVAELAKSKSFTDRKLELHIAGQGPELESLQMQAKQLAIEDIVNLMGFRHDIPELLAQADLFLLCSDSEGMPTVLLEAISLGCKAVATAVGGIPEIVEKVGPTAVNLVPANNLSLLVTALQKALTASPAQASQVQQTKQLVATHFSPEIAAIGYQKLLAELSDLN